jgi:DNA-binding LacI/PurR family transcriptional regulator
VSTINDVAKMAGVSKSTVSNVFSGKRSISQEVKNRVLEIARELNYRPNYFARSLAIKESKIIGLNILGSITKISEYHLSFINGVLKECHEKGYRLLINTQLGEKDAMTNYEVSGPADGEILLDPYENDHRIYKIIEEKIPLVLVGRPPKKYRNKVSYINHDNVQIAKEMTQYLINEGHRDILFLNTIKEKTVSQDRTRGFILAYEEMDEEIPTGLIKFNPMNKNSIEYGYSATLSMLAQNKKITAIMADSDNVAQGVYNALQELGLKIPADVSVVAYGYCPDNKFLPPLTCVDLKAELMGIEATKMLIEQCYLKEEIIKNAILPSKIMVRDSVKSLDKQGDI